MSPELELPKLLSFDPEETAPRFSEGVQTFSRLFSRWMDLNGWSHPLITSLARSCLGGASWLHSSQISGLRASKLTSPGPRVFIGIERLNYYLYRYQTEKKLLPGTSSSNFYSEPFIVTENGQPPSLGWWIEVFCGYRIPADIDLRQPAFSEQQAESLSRAWGRFVRKVLAMNDYDLITDLEKAVREHYPACEASRTTKLLEVIRNATVWTPAELAHELPSLAQMSESLGETGSSTQLLKRLEQETRPSSLRP